MSKTYKDLMEDINSIVPAGLKPTGMNMGIDHYAKEHMLKYCQQISSAVQPELPILLAQIEKELNKFGYSLGELDHDVDLDNSGDAEDFCIFVKATGDMLNNCYLQMDWERLAAPVVVDYRYDGGKLINAVLLTLEEVTPEELQAMLRDMENTSLKDPELSREPNPSEDGFSIHDA